MADTINNYERHISQIPQHTDVLITHQPPLSILDYSGNVHWGNHTLLEQVTQVNPQYHLVGHVHESYGIEKIGHTIYVNSALTDNVYRLSHQPTLLKM